MNFSFLEIKYLWAKFFKKVCGAAISNSRIHNTSKIEAGSTFINSSMARHSFCGYGCTIINCDIGGFCSIADNVSIGVAGRHPLHFVSTSPVFLAHKDSVKTKFSHFNYDNSLRTSVESDVWIGERAMIKAGVTVGAGAVIGMGSVLTKDVAPYSIVGGNPAKMIRKRFTDDEIKLLLELKWWEMSDRKIYSLGPYFNELVKFIEQAKRV